MIDGEIILDDDEGCKTCNREMRWCIIHDTSTPFTHCSWWKPHPTLVEMRINL